MRVDQNNTGIGLRVDLAWEVLGERRGVMEVEGIPKRNEGYMEIREK